jgi:hypothetical protein
MRIGIDAHIILPKHKRYDPKIAAYTEDLILHLLDADKKEEHIWVLFFDSRMEDTKKFSHKNGKKRKNVEIKHFPFIQYRSYLPVLYSHMLISAFLTAARLDVFHSPEGLIPFVYPGRIITTFHYVPRGESESNIFVRTFMLGARTAFAQLCRRAYRIIVSKPADRKLLVERHSYPAERVVVTTEEGSKKKDWETATKQLVKLYQEVINE